MSGIGKSCSCRFSLLRLPSSHLATAVAAAVAADAAAAVAVAVTVAGEITLAIAVAVPCMLFASSAGPLFLGAGY